ncbi:MAG: C39 family peptidase [Clostridiaceae bacterium]|nr:C39 family peptidase [Clostridiaceae bacterium]
MSYHNQFSYKTIPYPHASRPDATVATSGCGVCCMSMVVEGIMGEAWPPKQSAAYSISVGARASTGTDMALLGHKTADKFELEHKTSSNVNVLTEALQNGAWAIANVGGDRAGYTGLFSDAGHYIAVRGIKDGKFIVWDPAYYVGKFNKAGRAGKVTVSGSDIYVLPEYLDKDCSNRAPRYYIFGEEAMTQAQFNEMMNVYLESRDKLPLSSYAKEYVDKAKADGISDGTSPRNFATREEVITMIMRAKK